MSRRKLPSRGMLARHLARNIVVVGLIIGAALGVGAIGYHAFDGLPWLDATLNAAMILTGMGPVNPVTSPSAKIFATVYALFSGVFFLSMTAIILAPAANYFLHRFHLEFYGDGSDAASAPAAPNPEAPRKAAPPRDAHEPAARTPTTQKS